MAKKSKYRGSSLKGGIELYGVSELLKKIEKAGGNVDKACEKAVDMSLQIVGADMQNFMSGHKFTGETMSSYEQVPAVVKNNKVEAVVGYDINKGGLPAIFLDVGTPKQKPYFFRYYAVANNSAKLQEIQRATLEEILEGLK